MPASPETTLMDIVAAVRASASALSGITDTGRIFHPRAAPQQMSHRSFAISVRARNTNKFRSDPRRSMRKAATIIIRVSHRMNPRDEVSGLPEMLADLENIEAAVWDSDEAPLNGVARVRTVVMSEPNPTPEREFVHTDITLDVEYVRDASTVIVVAA